MPQLFIHVGPPKTGSSSLQRFFQANASALLVQGIFYPETGRGALKAHVPLAEALEATPEPQTPALWQQLMQELAQSPADALLSAEQLISQGARLRQVLADSGRRVKILFYLRRQDQRLESLINQHLKTGKYHLGEPLDSFYPGLDYAAVLGQWAHWFGKENLLVRRFEPAAWPLAGGLCADALAAMDRNWDASLVEPPRIANQSLGLNTLVLLQMAKEHNLPRLGQFRQALLQMQEPLRPVLSPAERSALLQRFAASNQQVATEYLHLPQGQPLFAADPQTPEPDFAPFYPEADFFARFALELWKKNAGP